MNEMPVVHVHVENLSDMHPTRTEEVEAQHYTESSFILPPLGPTSAGPTQILQLDPLRKRAVLTFNGTGQVILAHSAQQAQSLQANVQQAADEGCLITCPAAISVESTGPLWAIGYPTSAATAPATLMTGSISGAVAAPGAGASIATTPALPAGTYTVTATIYTDGAVVAATDDDNMSLGITGVTSFNLIYPATPAQTVQFTYTLTIAANKTLNVKAIGAATAGTTYHAHILYTQIAGALASGSMTVGVSQERRNS